MAAEAAFKDVPEIFEVRLYNYFYHLPPSRSFHRSSWEKPSSHEQKLLVRAFTFLPSLYPHFQSIPSATFRELGPPDLCHVVKSTGRAGQRDVSAGLVHPITNLA
jgi:hypothetical protein